MLVFGCLWWGGALNTGSGRHSVGTGGQWLRSLRQPGVAPQPRVNLYPSTLRICLEVLRVHAEACAPSWYPTCFSMPTGSRETIGCGTVLFRVADLFVCVCGEVGIDVGQPFLFTPCPRPPYPGYPPAFPPPTSPASPTPQPQQPATVAAPGRGRGVAPDRHHTHRRPAGGRAAMPATPTARAASATSGDRVRHRRDASQAA